MTPEDAWDGKGFPPVFKGPSEDSGKLGVASGVVYVAWPLQKQNGFVQILRFGGDVGWISEVCDQATISRAGIERRLYFVVAW